MKHFSIFKRIGLTILVCLFQLNVWAQVKQISGTVSDEKGEPLIGVNVSVKGGTNGAITDLEGKFSLNVEGKDVVVFSYIGYITQEIRADDPKIVKVALIEDSETLDEVVVVGYGVMKKSDVTGSISSLKSKDLTSVPTSNVLEAMQGKIAGLDMTKSDGEAGSALNFTLRGNRSLNASNAPLIMVDGVAYGSTLDINPYDIESIEVLKDASSTAIYGSRGANGVILITTKRGSAGKTNVSFNAYFGPQMAAGLADIMNAEQYAALKREAYRTQGITDDNSIFTANELQGLKNHEYLDFQDMCVNKGFVQNYEVSVNGGNEKTQVNLSLGYYKETGLFKNDDLTRFNGMIGVDQTITKRLKVGASMLLTYKDNNKRQDPLNQANKIVPIGKAYNDDGTLNMFPSYGSATSVSPLADEQPNAYKNNTLTKRLFGTAYLNWEIIDNLLLRTTLGVDLNSSRRGYFYDKNTINGGTKESKSGGELGSNNNYTWETTLNYNKTFGEHGFNFLLGNSVISNHAETFDLSGKNQTFAGNLFWNLASATDQREIASGLVEDKMVSFFGRIHYKLKDKYSFNVSLRADGSSVLADGHKWGYFPSAAFAWRIIDENFMKDATSFMSDLKLRLSWGLSGNSAISPYQTLGGLGSTTYSFGEVGAYGYFPRNIANKDLGWENTRNYTAERTYMDASSQTGSGAARIVNDIVYTDGFGRKEQDIQIGGSPGGNADLVLSYTYNMMGQVEKEYLPYAKTGNNGAFDKFSPERWSVYGTGEQAYAYNLTQYEDSPLMRVSRKMGPGKAWHASDKSVRVTYGMNSTNEVKCYKVSSSGSLIASGFYGAGQLEVIIETDEDGHRSKTYTDSNERTLLTVSVNGEDSLATYYVYDDRNCLRYVLPPEARNRPPVTYTPGL